MYYLGNLIINGMYLYFFLSIIVNQYYSLKRFIKVSINVIFSKLNIVILLVELVSLVFFKEYKVLFYLLNLGFSILFIVINKPLKFKKTRRNLTLFLLSLLISIFILPLSRFTSCIVIILSYLLLLPLEIKINSIYKEKARIRLSKVSPKVIGITGSYGKTTFKNILYDVIKNKYITQVTPFNVNTPLGITKFINNELKDDTEVLIVEIGIDEKNGMNKFKDFLSLDIGIITSIGENHLANFKTLNNTLNSKMKIKNLIKKEGKLFLNNDDEYLFNIEEDNIIKFSKDKDIEVSIDINGLKYSYNNKEFLIPLYGSYIYSYLDGVIKISEFLGINKDYISLGLQNIRKIKRRLEVSKYKNGYFINDSYNININGVKESVNLLKSLDGNNVVILGGIIEQGKEFVKSNNKIKSLLIDLNVIFIGEGNHPLTKNHQYKNLYIVSSLKEGYVLLDQLSFNNILLLAKSDDIFLR